MEAIELRMGNFINYPLNTKVNPIVVNGVIGNKIYTDSFEGDAECFFPIPLTEEWLLKLGFEYSDSKIKDHPQLLSIEISSLETLDFEDGEFFISNASSVRVLTLWNQPVSVHQLQNLLFALKGKELTLNKNY
ncbi:hypothetical protein [Chryseobacterium lathyri]|uniref:hypothetical protein n=1 Tax=Chryseobacterium lathyri TaxID=395933 RepID=UPI001CBCFE7B|nr:hypothetical protein [Chryseobacterium lathyri]